MRIRPVVNNLSPRQWAALVASVLLHVSAHADAPPSNAALAEAPKIEAIQNSKLDAPLFYQLLVGEIHARQGDLGTAYQLYLDAAKRQPDAQLFQKAVDFALAGRAGEQALSAARAWRQAFPNQREPAEYTAQILIALGRHDEVAEPVRAMLRLSPTAALPGLMFGLNRSLQRISDRQVAAEVVDEITQPWREGRQSMPSAWLASAEAWMQAGQAAKAQAALNQAIALDPSQPGIGLIAAELMTTQPDAEALVQRQLREHPSDLVRLAYARKLVALGRLNEGGEQLEAVVQRQPDNAAAWLTLGAVRLEMRQFEAAEQALQRLLALPPLQQTDSSTATPGIDLETAWLLMAQIKEAQQRYAEADTWLQRADPTAEKIKVQATRAKLLARQGKLKEGRDLLKAMPESEPRDALTKVNAEAQLLREEKAYAEAHTLLTQANQRFRDDPELMYDLALMAEHLGRFEETERLLRRVMELKPHDPTAYNALGYSLADRGVQLDEARKLITRALEMRPGDPFITDSLGWLEFRENRPEVALPLLLQAYSQRQDADIAAHIGEVLWSLGRKEEAMRYWQEGRQKDPTNKTLLDTLKRLAPGT